MTIMITDLSKLALPGLQDASGLVAAPGDRAHPVCVLIQLKECLVPHQLYDALQGLRSATTPRATATLPRQ